MEDNVKQTVKQIMAKKLEILESIKLMEQMYSKLPWYFRLMKGKPIRRTIKSFKALIKIYDEFLKAPKRITAGTPTPDIFLNDLMKGVEKESEKCTFATGNLLYVFNLYVQAGKIKTVAEEK